MDSATISPYTDDCPATSESGAAASVAPPTQEHQGKQTLG